MPSDTPGAAPLSADVTPPDLVSPDTAAPDLTDVAWLKRFEGERGRPLRVLHIGNIANNAYNNAKIQRQRGIDADVLSFDYYHIMACPEWEDASYEGEVGDPFFPDWWATSLKGPRRPDWFVAGPLDACLRYLLAKTAPEGSAGRRRAPWLRRALTFELWMLSRRGSRARAWAEALMVRLAGRSVTYPGTPANAILMGALGARLGALGRGRAARFAGLGGWLRHHGARLARFGRTADTANDGARHLRLMGRGAPALRRRLADLVAGAGRDDPPGNLEFFHVWWWHPYLRTLLGRYDVVQAYATYTAMPLVAGLRSYVAYEHGTIRSIPFAPTDEGRMCLASYRAADAVLVTNIDNLDAAHRMRIPGRRVTPLPHAFDDEKLTRFAARQDAAIVASAPVVTFFTPARQHWVDADPGWAKGNDRVFEALRLLKDEGLSLRLRAVEWGQDVAASKERVAALGIGEMVEWVAPMRKDALWREYLRAHAVVDQFVVPAFGGVTFEAMTFGRRVLTRLDAASAARFFGRAPPLSACSTAAEIADAMRAVVEDPADARGAGAANAAWVRRHHSADRVVALQAGVYRRLVEGGEAAQDRAQAALLRRSLAVVRPFYSARPWARTSAGREVVMLVVSVLRIDPRVEREARALAARGWSVRVIAPDISEPSHAAAPLDWGAGVTFHLLPAAAANYVMERPWLVSEAMLGAALAFRPFAYHCHDLNTALVGLRAARETGARCLCDFHEWYSENVSWNAASAQWEPHEPNKRDLYRWAERHALRRADRVITVNQSIATELDALGRLPPGSVRVLRNIPPLAATPTRPYPPLKAQLGLPESAFVVLYQGGTGPSRMLEPVIRALAHAPSVTLVIRGPSLDLFGEDYRAVAREAGAAERLVLLDGVPSRDVVEAARGADVGLWTLPNLSRNFNLALPNKIFEYLAAGLPLLVADFPEARRIAVDMGVGLAFDPYEPASIGAAMRRYAEDPGFARARREAVPRALDDLDADREWDRLGAIYDELLAEGAARAGGAA